jgi:hypothetical protein
MRPSSSPCDSSRPVFTTTNPSQEDDCAEDLGIGPAMPLKVRSKLAAEKVAGPTRSPEAYQEYVSHEP